MASLARSHMDSLTTTTTKYEPLSLSKAIMDSTDPHTTAATDPAVLALLNMDDVDVNENLTGNYNDTQTRGATPLMLALANTWRGEIPTPDTDLIKLLLNRGDVNMNKIMEDGSTALFFAGMYNSIEALRLLLLFGSQNYPPLDVTIKDNEGNTALDMLQLGQQQEMVDLLQTYIKTGVVSPAAPRRTAQRQPPSTKPLARLESEESHSPATQIANEGGDESVSELDLQIAIEVHRRLAELNIHTTVAECNTPIASKEFLRQKYCKGYE